MNTDLAGTKILTIFITVFLVLSLFSVGLFADVSLTIIEPVEGSIVTPCLDLLVKFDVSCIWYSLRSPPGVECKAHSVSCSRLYSVLLASCPLPRTTDH